MPNESILETIKRTLTDSGFVLVAEDYSRGDNYFEPESFAIRDSSGVAYFVSVSRLAP